MSYRLHILALAAAAASANLCFDEDFAVVAGQTADGELVLPTCTDTTYLCAAGVPGLPYLGQLGHVGARLDFNFPKPVTAILVVTTSTQKPIPQAVYTAPAPVQLIVVDFRLINRYQEPDGEHWVNLVELTFSDHSIHHYLIHNVAGDYDYALTVSGKTADELVAAGWEFDV